MPGRIASAISDPACSMQIVPILYGERDFGAFGDFDDFVESVSYGVFKTCQVRGSNPCRGATYFARTFSAR